MTTSFDLKTRFQTAYDEWRVGKHHAWLEFSVRLACNNVRPEELREAVNTHANLSAEVEQAKTDERQRLREKLHDLWSVNGENDPAICAGYKRAIEDVEAFIDGSEDGK